MTILRDALDLEFGDGRLRIATLATVDEERRPRARSVVVRRIDDDGALHIVSDARSAKNTHLRENPFVELVFWLPNKREQFRLAGRVEITGLADPGGMLIEFWAALPDASRALFFWPAPSQPYRTTGQPDFPTAVPAPTPPPESFEVITLRPQEVDHLQLHFTPHRRTRYREAHAWQPEPINP